MIIVAHSALEYWQKFRADAAYYGLQHTFPGNNYVSHTMPLGKPRRSDATALTDEQLEQLLTELHLHLTYPVDIGVATRQKCWITQLKRAHLLSKLSQYRGFARIERRTFIATPEHAYIQIAPSLSFVDKLCLGYGLCGHYAVASSDNGGGSHIQLVDALTSVDLIKSFIDHNPGLRGCGQVRPLLKYLHNGSASPMETALTLILCLPVYYGGYGLPFPHLNAPVDPAAHKLPELQQRHFRCDLMWRDAKLVIEYDGEESHVGIEHIAHDSSRRNDLNHLGFTVLSVTKKQLYHKDALARLATQIAKNLGVRLWHKYSRSDWETHHNELIQQLLYEPDRINVIHTPACC